MYYCGVTVYDYCPGHASLHCLDVVRRYCNGAGITCNMSRTLLISMTKFSTGHVEGSSMEAVAERFIQAYFEDMARLNIKEADAYPRATTPGWD